MIDDSKKLWMIYEAIGLAGGPQRADQEHSDLYFLRVINWIFRNEVPPVYGTSSSPDSITSGCTELKPICNCQGQ